MPPGTDNYLAQWQKGARAKAKDLGYDIKIIETTRDQAEQDSQVQQESPRARRSPATSGGRT